MITSGVGGTTGTAGSVCSKCGAGTGQAHRWDDDDCILDHPDHAARYIGLVCRRHYHWIDSTLDQILELFALLPEAVQPATGVTDGRGGSPDPAAPGRLDVMALTDRRNPGPRYVQITHDRNWNGRTLEDNGPDYPDVLGVIECWVRLVIDERGLGGLPDFLPFTGMIALLRAHRHWIAQQPWIDDYTIELHDMHLALSRGVRDSMWPASIGKCPNCTAKLYPTIGKDEVSCRKCRSAWTGIDLARLRLILEQEAG